MKRILMILFLIGAGFPLLRAADIPTTAWDETSPSGTDPMSEGDDRVRELKTQIREVIDADHIFDSSGQHLDMGKHNKVTLSTSTTPTTIQSYEGVIYTKTAGDQPELFFIDAAENEVQISTYGAIKGGVIQSTSIAGWQMLPDTISGTNLADAVPGAGLEKDGSENLRIDTTTVAGDGLQGGGEGVLGIDVSDFAGTGLEDDGSENLRIDTTTVAGDGLQGGGAGVLRVNVDDTTVEISADTVHVKDGGIGANKLGTAATFNSAVTRYISIGPASFLTQFDNTDTWVQSNVGTSPTSLSAGSVAQSVFAAPVNLPHGATVTSLKVYWYRDDASAHGYCYLLRDIMDGDELTDRLMAFADSNATSGAHSVEDTSISFSSIDNSTYHYRIYLDLSPNDAAADVRLYAVVITYTITAPLP
jgi:hypothetical protein